MNDLELRVYDGKLNKRVALLPVVIFFLIVEMVFYSIGEERTASWVVSGESKTSGFGTP